MSALARDGLAPGTAAATPPLFERLFERRTKYLVAAACIAICTIMLLPLLASVLPR